MNLLLQKSAVHQKFSVQISGSKSETNRLLLLQALYPELIIENASNSDDSEVMLKALQSENRLKDIHHAGTAMRFLTAYFSVVEGNEVVLTGSSRMQERPIKVLVDALRALGAEIHYEKEEGFPPLRIVGKKLLQSKVSLPADVSSQYISALLLIAPKLENGLELNLAREITSAPYIKMTLALLDDIGVATSFEGNTITVAAKKDECIKKNKMVESDWSSASYWYSIVALAEIGTQITLSSFMENSLQGDSVLAAIYEDFGVTTQFEGDVIVLTKSGNFQKKAFDYHLNNAPDIAQTLAVTCFGLGVACNLDGLHTLKIKETDRLEALKNELVKLGAAVSVTHDSLHLQSPKTNKEGVTIQTYQDHRMAMAFAPLALKMNLIIEEAEVVSKSYPNFWNDLKLAGFQITEL